MGWNVSHGSNQNGEERRSYTTVANLAAQLAHALPGRDWKKIRVIFDRPTGDPFTVSARRAAACADTLDKAAASGHMQPNWAAEARIFAAAARRAANSGQNWKWR